MTNMADSSLPDNGPILFYQSEDGQTSLDVRLQEETVWISLNQMAELFDRDKSVVFRHFHNIFHEGELARPAVVAKNATAAADGKTYQIDSYNLDAIISVGYWINSRRSQRYRACSNWAGCLVFWSQPQAPIERKSSSALSAGVKAYG